VVTSLAVQLYTYPLSHYCIKVQKILEYKGIPYRSIEVKYNDRTPLLKASGQDYIPYLVDDGQGFTWPHIVDHLERKAPTPTLYPDGNKGKAAVLEHWAHAVVEEAVWRYVVTDAEKYLARRDEAEAWVFGEMQSRARGPWHLLEHRKPEFYEGMKEVLALVEKGLDGKPYYGGNAPSLADFALYGAISPLYTVGGQIPAEFQTLRAWWGRLDGKKSA